MPHLMRNVLSFIDMKENQGLSKTVNVCELAWGNAEHLTQHLQKYSLVLSGIVFG